MKVLMTADTLGGVFTYAVELIAALRERSVEVAVATLGRPTTPGEAASLSAAGPAAVYESAFALEWMADPWRDVDAARQWLVQLEERESPDVVHLNSYGAAAAPFSAPVVVVGHSCVLSWWSAVHAEPAPQQWDRYREAVKAGIRRADAVVAPSRWMLGRLAELYGPLPRTNKAILNGSSEPFGNRPEVGHPERLVLAAGRMWDRAKNLEAVGRAAVLMRADATVAVAGDIGGQAQPAGLRLLGHLERGQLRKWRRRASVFASPARYEPFGLGVLEAARAGCALVLGNIPSLRELWEGCAVFVEPDDAYDLVAKLDGLLLHPDRTRHLGALARDRSRHYAASAMAEAYISLYEQLGPRRESLAA